MSAISSTSQLQGYFSSFRRVTVSGAAPATSTNAAVGSTESTDTASTVGGGVSSTKADGFKQLQAAVTDALNAAKSDPTSDPNKTIQSAIAKFFKANGGPKGHHGGRPHGPPPAGARPAGGTDPDGDKSIVNSADTAKSAFQQTLQSFGVNAQQFHQDFLAAVKNAQNGTVNSATAFAGVPSGTTVDTTA